MDSLFSDSDSMSESSSYEDQEDIESLYGGQARNIFSSLEETIEKIDDFLLFERKFMHGDIVRLVSDPSGQMGKVVNVDMAVDLENIYGLKIRNVSTKNLQKLHSVSVGDYVVSGAWIGKVEKVVDCLTILFDDGTKCQLSTVGPEKVISLSPDLTEDSECPFYPGRRVKVESSSISKSTRWLCGIRNNKQDRGTICNVDAGIVHVDWLNFVEKGSTPPCLQDAKNLSVLSCFPHANWQLGDRCVLQTEQILPSANALSLVKGHKQSEVVNLNFQHIAVIAKTNTKLDVQWQDGSQSMGLDSHLLCPVNVVDDHDFFPDAFVLEKGADDDLHIPGFKKWGIVRSVDPKERTVKVKWCNFSVESEAEQIEEIVSAYELVEHPDYSFCLGEAVFKTGKGDVDLEDGNLVRNQKIFKAVENCGLPSEYLNKKCLSNFGTVVGYKDGDVEVKWATGVTSKVTPNEIYRVDECEGTTATPPLGDENVPPPNVELPLKNQFSGQNSKDVSDLNYENEKNYSPPSISQLAIGAFTNFISSLFGHLTAPMNNGHGCKPEYGQILGMHPEEEALKICNLNLGAELPVFDDLDMPVKITSQLIKEAAEDTKLPAISESPKSFRQFDIVNDCSDHHFVDESVMDQVRRSWFKKVQQEWSILEKDLPETIYVRVYEERMDLIRAAIVGTAGTPYHDGLFFFDIHLPSQYPTVPPMVYYNSGGLRINPNLYESGKVCLSLLNTWTGSQSEAWNPGSSTILQVLLSLQALVLNEKPYFNEAGYDTQIGKAEAEKNSVSYNENAFLGSCRSMLYLLRRPPKHFEALVDEHFSQHNRNILLACKAYMQGAPVGHPVSSCSAEEEIQKGSSTGFKIMLGKIYPRLVEAFSNKGIDCSNLDDVP